MSQLTRLVTGLDGEVEPDFAVDVEVGRLFRRELSHAAGLVEVFCGGPVPAFMAARSIEYFGAHEACPGRTLDEILRVLRAPSRSAFHR